MHVLTVLYVGLEAGTRDDVKVIHLPLIQIIPRPHSETASAFAKLHEATHIIMTSKSAVQCSKEHLLNDSVKDKQYICVGKATAGALQNLGIQNIATAENECQEGIIELIDAQELKNSLFFWAHSSRSRPILKNYFEKKGYAYIECLLYDTQFIFPETQLELQKVDEIHFTSPSCVEAFFHFFGPPPKHIKLHTKGHVTQSYLDSLLS